MKADFSLISDITNEADIRQSSSVAKELKDRMRSIPPIERAAKKKTEEGAEAEVVPGGLQLRFRNSGKAGAVFQVRSGDGQSVAGPG